MSALPMERPANIYSWAEDPKFDAFAKVVQFNNKLPFPHNGYRGCSEDVVEARDAAILSDAPNNVKEVLGSTIKAYHKVGPKLKFVANSVLGLNGTHLPSHLDDGRGGGAGAVITNVIYRGECAVVFRPLRAEDEDIALRVVHLMPGDIIEFSGRFRIDWRHAIWRTETKFKAPYKLAKNHLGLSMTNTNTKTQRHTHTFTHIQSHTYKHTHIHIYTHRLPCGTDPAVR